MKKIAVRLYSYQPRRFAAGGLASAADHVQGAGRMGDSILIHINPHEFRQMRAAWGDPSVNPHTGLPEYGFFSNLFNSIKKSATPWTVNSKDVEDIKNGTGIAGLGTPLHGLTAGYSIGKATDFGNPLKPLQNARELVKGQKTFGQQFADQRALSNRALKENIVPIVTALTYGAGSALAGAGGAASDAGAAGAADVGGGALADAGVGTVGDIGAATAADALPEIVVTGTQGGAGALGAAAADVASTAPGALAAASTDSGSGAADSSDNLVNDEGHATPPHDASSTLQKLGNYVEDPKNWQNIAKVGGALGSLFSKPAGGAPPPGGFGPATNLTPGSSGRDYQGYGGNYYTYGQSGGEHQFFTPHATGGPANLVQGPGSGRDDKIPAALSDGEYVMDAETVSLLGDGSAAEGARKLDEMRRRLRQHKGKELVKGKFSQNAGNPEQYIGEGK